jgi:hypothetical protein
MAGEVIISGLTNHTTKVVITRILYSGAMYAYVNANHPQFVVKYGGGGSLGTAYLYYRTSDTGSWILDSQTPVSPNIQYTLDSTGTHAFRWLAGFYTSGVWLADNMYLVGNSGSRRSGTGRLVYILNSWNGQVSTSSTLSSNFTTIRGTAIVNASHVVLV